MNLPSKDLILALLDGDIEEIAPARLRELGGMDLVAARRAALLNLLWVEAGFLSEGLVARVEDLLGRGCFGPSLLLALRNDLKYVRKLLAERGYRLVYSRKAPLKGYSISGRPRLAEHLRRQIAGSVAEVDPRQVKVLHKLNLAQRFAQGFSLMDLVEKVAAYRLVQRRPSMKIAEARRIARERIS